MAASNEEMKTETKEELKLSRSDELINTVDESFDVLLDGFKDMSKMFREKVNETKSLQSKVRKMVKSLRKEKRNKRDQKSKPSGFNNLSMFRLKCVNF